MQRNIFFYDVGCHDKTEACKFWSWWTTYHNYDKVITAWASLSASSTFVKWDNKNLQWWGGLKWAKQGQGKKIIKSKLCVNGVIKEWLWTAGNGNQWKADVERYDFFFSLRLASLLSLLDWYGNMADRKLTVKCIFQGNISTKCIRKWILGSTDFDFPEVIAVAM